MIARILIAAIPVTAMLFTEVVLQRRKKRRRISPETNPSCEAGVPQGTARRVEPDLKQRDVMPKRRRRQDDRYFQSLYQTAQAGSLSAMNKLGEFALVRRNFVEAFYWKLMLEMRHGNPSGLPAQGVCRVWQDLGCPAQAADKGGSFTENQSRLAMAVLDLWSGRHVHTPKETIRKMVEEGDRDALLYAKRFGIGQTRS